MCVSLQQLISAKREAKTAEQNLQKVRLHASKIINNNSINLEDKFFIIKHFS